MPARRVVFNSLIFAAFFAVVLVVSRSSVSWRARKAFLTAASFGFYAAWNPPLVLILALSTLVDWRVGLQLEKTQAPRARKHLLWLSLGVNLGMLAAFKYSQFFVNNFIALAGHAGVTFTPVDLGILLPVGISFYTFQTLSYTLDVYRRQLPATRSLLDFALFVSFFPQLVAGPIVRASDFLPQLERPRRATPEQLSWGACLLVLGLFQKVVLADGIMAPIVDGVYVPGTVPSTGAAWAGTLAFSAQIFYDFAGYSLAAIGVAMMLGFELPDNFRRPYGALGFSDFWRRWHISLSSWLRDYLYISLGGNRIGRVRTYVNLCLTMLLGGLWHGASWNFVVWGALHGSYLVAERGFHHVTGAARWKQGRGARVAGRLVTYALVCLAWVFFRAADLPTSLAIVKAMLGVDAGAGGVAGEQVVALVVVALLLVTHGVGADTTFEQLAERTPVWAVALLMAVMLVLVLSSAGGRAFIYFQF